MIAGGRRGPLGWTLTALSVALLGGLAGGVIARAGVHSQDGSTPDGVIAGDDAAGSSAAAVQEGELARTRADLLPATEELIAQYDCLSCHAPESPLRTRLDAAVAPVLRGVTRRAAPGWITQFLLDPRATRPGTTHPNQLIGIPDNLRDSVAEDLTHFLHSIDGGDSPSMPVERGSLAALEEGRQLFHQVGCVACHGPQESVEDLGYSLVDLAQFEAVEDEPVTPALTPLGVLETSFTPIPVDLVRKQSVSDLAAFLLDPVAIRPGGFCPSMSLGNGEAQSIAQYLLRAAAQRVDGSFERRPGILMEVFEGKKGGTSRFALLSENQASAVRVVREIGFNGDLPADHFALRFSGLIDVPEDGEYLFALTSDDGSRLRVAGELVVNNGGVHAMQERTGSITLEAGLHSLILEYFEAEGGEGLKVAWKTPADAESGPIPGSVFSHWPLEFAVRGVDGLPVEDSSFTVEQARAERGQRAFGRLGCATCHDGVLRSDVPSAISAPTLEKLNGVRPGVLICLRAGRRYDFQPETVGQLLSAFVDSDSIATDAASPARAVERHMVRRNCYSCHRRDGVGGVHPTLMSFFTGDEDAELGDQGRFPPTLSHVGRKFRPSVLRDALQGEETVRPYLNTRMPKMGADNVLRLAERLEAADLSLKSLGLADDETDGDFVASAKDIDTGRRLAGDRGGLGCVQCHGFLGTRSLGVQAVDLGQMHRRLRFEWFKDLLQEPGSVDMSSRMATFWVDGVSPVEDLAGGDIDQQIQALWSWLGEQESMAPPPGLDTGPWAFEVDPSMSLRLVAVFMKDLSPSVLCIGNPAGIHFAFDVQNGRLAKAWRGRFLNAMGTWQGRAGALESPGSTDVVDFMPGFAVAPLDRLNAVWPTPYGPSNPSGLKTRSVGRTVGDDGAVTMRYMIGEMLVAETLRPVELGVRISKKAKANDRLGVERSFEIRMPRGGVGGSVVARVAAARTFERAGTGKWRVNGKPWPLFEVDANSVRTAKLVDPSEDQSGGFGSGGGSRPSVDGRVRAGGLNDRGPESAGPLLTELRIPILMAPADDGSGDLVGTFSWSYAW
ncbi:MAG: cytochrome c551/c552 [Planctomycetota bacterium]|jgi:cytochrome c551/c552